MKKKLLLSLTVGLTFISQVLFAQTDNWSPIITDGFGSTQNYNAISFQEFNDTLYTACGRSGGGQAEMYRSADGVTWTQVFYGGTPTTKGIASIMSDTIDGGYMWIATGDLVQGTKVYRTQNGTSWTPISTGGFGNSGLWSPTPHMVLFQGTSDTIPYLYAAGNSHGASAISIVLRTPYTNTNPANWDTIVDFNLRDTNVTQVTYFYIWNSKLYFGTNGDSLLYESTDGINFTANTGVATDFLGADLLIACLAEFNGNLYAGTNNQSPLFGGQLYRTPDGINWTNITYMLPGHDSIVDEELHALDTANGFLWVTPYTDTTFSTSGIAVWRSTDNTVSAFVQSNTDGFGNPDIDGENPNLYGFKGREYFGGPNYNSGAQIWRTDLFTAMNETENKSCKTTVFPNPFSNNAIIQFDSDCAEISQLAIYDMIGNLILSFENPRDNQIKIEKNNLNTGMYFYQIHTKIGVSTTGKFIIE